MAVTAAATMITKPSTLRKGVIEMPAMRSPSPAKNPTPASAARRRWTRRTLVPRSALTNLGSSAASAASICSRSRCSSSERATSHLPRVSSYACRHDTPLTRNEETRSLLDPEYPLTCDLCTTPRPWLGDCGSSLGCRRGYGKPSALTHQKGPRRAIRCLLGKGPPGGAPEPGWPVLVLRLGDGADDA